MLATNTITDIDRRRNNRYAYARYVFFATSKQFFQGELKDYSQHGLFIKSAARLAVGDIIVELNNRPITGAAEFERTLSSSSAGSPFTLAFLRRKTRMTAKGVLLG